MYYVLFTYIKKHGKGWLPFSMESKVIEFLHESYEDIKVVKIIEVKAEHRLGLIVTEDYVKSTLEPEKIIRDDPPVPFPEEETESLVELEKKPEEIMKENKKTLEELEDGEPSAMSKIGDDIEEEMEEELTPEQKTKKAMEDANGLIEREKKREEQRKKGWKLCTKCNSNRVAPWNESKICSACQNERKTTRPYARKTEFSGL